MHAPQLQYGLATEACADAYTAACAQEPHCAPSNAASALQWRRLDRGRWGLPTLANDHQTGCPRDHTSPRPPFPFPAPAPSPTRHTSALFDGTGCHRLDLHARDVQGGWKGVG